MKSTQIIYSLTIEDIQTVANAEIERDLTSDEIENLVEPIATKIRWYEAIADSISERQR